VLLVECQNKDARLAAKHKLLETKRLCEELRVVSDKRPGRRAGSSGRGRQVQA
jgi:hypothetical protein